MPRLATLSTGAALVAAAAALALPNPTTAQWKVETNSLHIKEPTSIAGDFDAAIGDVSVVLFLKEKGGSKQQCPSHP